MSKQPFICLKCGTECEYRGDIEVGHRVHEIHRCTNDRCGLTWSPVRIKNGKKEVTAG